MNLQACLVGLSVPLQQKVSEGGQVVGNPKLRKKRVFKALKSETHKVLEELQRTGHRAVVSGIYQVEHPEHFSGSKFWIQKDTLLPFCPGCGEPIKFRLLERINYIHEDPDFSR